MPSVSKAFGVGLCLGAITGLLYAPKSGKETRAFIMDKAVVVKDRAVDSASWVGSKTRQIVNAVRAPVTGDGHTAEIEVPVYRTIEYYIEAFPVEEEPGERELAQQRATSTLTEQAEKEIKVLGPDGGEVGQLKGVLMDPQGQTVQYGVVALNDRKNERDLCAVPWSELKENEEGNYQGNYTCAIPRQSMAESPKFTERELKNQARNRGIIDRIRSYYNRDSGQPSDKENQ